MRYRRVTARYVQLVSIRGAQPYGDVLRAFAPPVALAPLQWQPAADVCETESSITVVMDVAGMDDDAIDIQLYEDALIVEGERRVDACGPAGFYHAAEIRQGRFHVEVAVGAGIEHDRVQASYVRGVLRIELPKGHRDDPARPPAAGDGRRARTRGPARGG